MPALINLVGEQFGYLTVVDRVPLTGKHTLWLCKCRCGFNHTVEMRHLRNGAVKSCGCASNEMRSANNGHATHRLSKSKSYKTWVMMKQRCNNPNYNHFHYYGGRGITYDERWESFENFLEDMGERPADMTLERVDNELGYSKHNCRWASREEQLDNRRNSRTFELRGVFKPLKEWASITGTTRTKLYNYLYRRSGWTLEFVLEHLGLLDRALKVIPTTIASTSINLAAPLAGTKP